jgi:hypothetical protein
MNYASLKYLLLLLMFSQTVFSQESKFDFTLAYSPTTSRLTNGEENEKSKIGHNAIFRITYSAKGIIDPTVGLGFLNTGEEEFLDFSNEIFQGQIEIENIHNYNYLYLPIGAKINFSRFYLLPEIGLGVMVSNRTKQITKRPIVSDEKTVQLISLDSEAFNALTFPLLLSLGTDFKVGNYSLSTGVKGYYGLNQVVKTDRRNDHYFGIGLNLALNL